MARDKLGRLDDLNSEGFSRIKQILIAGDDDFGIRGQRTSEEHIVLWIAGVRFLKLGGLDHRRVFLEMDSWSIPAEHERHRLEWEEGILAGSRVGEVKIAGESPVSLQSREVFVASGG